MNMLQMSEAMRDGRSISLKSQTQLIDLFQSLF